MSFINSQGLIRPNSSKKKDIVNTEIDETRKRLELRDIGYNQIAYNRSPLKQTPYFTRSYNPLVNNERLPKSAIYSELDIKTRGLLKYIPDIILEIINLKQPVTPKLKEEITNIIKEMKIEDNDINDKNAITIMSNLTPEAKEEIEFLIRVRSMKLRKMRNNQKIKKAYTTAELQNISKNAPEYDPPNILYKKGDKVTILPINHTIKLIFESDKDYLRFNEIDLPNGVVSFGGADVIIKKPVNGIIYEDEDEDEYDDIKVQVGEVLIPIPQRDKSNIIRVTGGRRKTSKESNKIHRKSRKTNKKRPHHK